MAQSKGPSIRARKVGHADTPGLQESRSIVVEPAPSSVYRNKQMKMKQQNDHSPLWWKRFKANSVDLLHSLKPWSGHVKTMQGCFGSGVASYFRFLGGLLLLNIPMLLISVSFVVCPQIIYRWTQQQPPGYAANVEPFTGAELLTGAGWFLMTELYYGYYLNGSVNVTGAVYNMKFAYLCASTGCYVLTLIAVCYVLSTSYQKVSVLTAQLPGMSSFTAKVLSSWDHRITSKDAAAFHSKRIYTEIREHLSDKKKEIVPRDWNRTAKLVAVRVIVNLCILAALAGSGYLMWYLIGTQALENDLGILRQLALPLCISALNYILPFIFAAVVHLERYEEPQVPLYLTLLRTVTLYYVTLGVFVATWYIKIHDCSYSTEVCPQCWETAIGEQLYSMIVIDFLFIIAGALISELAWGLILRHCHQRFLPPPEFDVGRNTLNVIYSQILVWLGMYFSPLLSLVMIMKLVIIFYAKRVIVAVSCVPPKKAWKTGRVVSFIYLLVFTSFLLCLGSVLYAMFGLHPSQTCGPFQGYNYTYDIFTELVHQSTGNEIINGILNVIFSTATLIFLSLGLIVAVYYSYIVAAGHSEIAEMLHKQIKQEREERCFLLSLLQKTARDGGNSNTLSSTLSTSQKISPDSVTSHDTNTVT